MWWNWGGNPGLTGCLPDEREWEAWEYYQEHGMESSPPECPQPSWAHCGDGVAVPEPGRNRRLVSDCVVLLKARDPLAGKATLDWAPDRPITTWEGITIWGDPPRVVGLTLPSRGLTGQLPPRLGQLGKLRDLQLSGNQLSGPIPSDLRTLALLKSLRLDGNQLIGPIPPTLGGLLQLETMHLHDNQLSGPIPATLTYPRTLKRLSVNGNAGFTGCLAPALRTVPENDLGQLALPDCPPPIPPADICENGTVVPNPSDNPGLIADCVALLTAKRSFVSDVPLDWEADRPIAEWEGITIGGTPARVQGLEFYDRGLGGQIAPQLADLSELRTLSLRYDYLSGTIPAELGHLRSLESLDLSGNLLTGPIPPELEALSGLVSLQLGWNLLTGPIPLELGTLPRLEVLRLTGNELSGPIPAELGGLTTLLRLDLAYNELSSPIPAELSSLTTLLQLDLAGNDLSGPIPAELGGLAALKDLDLSGNDLKRRDPGAVGIFAQLGKPPAGRQSADGRGFRRNWVPWPSWRSSTWVTTNSREQSRRSWDP